MLTACFFFLSSHSLFGALSFITATLLHCLFAVLQMNEKKTIRVRKALTLLVYTDVMEKPNTHAHAAQHGFSS